MAPLASDDKAAAADSEAGYFLKILSDTISLSDSDLNVSFFHDFKLNSESDSSTSPSTLGYP